MRVLVTIFFILFILAGVVLGALNADLVTYDLAFVQVQLPKGAALLGALVIGWMLGGLAAWLGMSARRRSRGADDKKQPPTRP
jgi:Protein of unknown function (DUF1049).